MRKFGVYAIRNILTGGIYVGSSADIDGRWRQHKSTLKKAVRRAAPLLLKAWKVYGDSAFVFEILEHTVSNRRDDLFQREQFWIDTLNTAERFGGYNSYQNARGPDPGRKQPPFSADHRAAIARARLGTKASETTKAKLSVAHLGKKLPPFTDAHRAAISLARCGVKASDVARANMSAASRGKKKPPFSDEHRAAISRAKLGVKNPALSRAKLGTKMSDAARANMSASSKGVKKSPEHAAKLRERIIAMNKSAEGRARTAERNSSRGS
jgi:group I intron endonuclease